MSYDGHLVTFKNVRIINHVKITVVVLNFLTGGGVVRHAERNVLIAILHLDSR